MPKRFFSLILVNLFILRQRLGKYLLKVNNKGRTMRLGFPKKVSSFPVLWVFYQNVARNYCNPLSFPVFSTTLFCVPAFGDNRVIYSVVENIFQFL